MTTGSEDERGPTEPTFDDVMNGFSFDSGRKAKRRRWGRRRNFDDEQPRPEPFEDEVRIAEQTEIVGHPEPSGPAAGRPFDDERYELDRRSTAVRPYAWTRGRTRSGYHLEIETLISTSPRGRDQMALLQVEHRAVAELCEQARSVAEVAALLAVPLGVAKVLVGDMAGLGLVAVHQSVSANGDVPDLALMERVLSGLRRL